MYKKILVALDGSKLAEAVLPPVRELANCLGSQIILLRVVTSPHYDYLVSDPGLAASLRDTMESEATAYIQPQVAALRREGLNVSGDVIVASSSVADTIIDFAKSIEADLIAMSTHGRTGPARWMMGSVADRVVRGAARPVLLIHPAHE